MKTRAYGGEESLRERERERERGKKKSTTHERVGEKKKKVLKNSSTLLQ